MRALPEAGIHRSYLYAVGYREDHIEKAYATDADAVILELEDAVAPAKKEAARATVASFLEAPPPKPTYVRVNPLESGLTYADVVAVGPASIEGVRMAKAATPEDVQVLGRWLEELGSTAGIQLLLESAAAVERAGELLAAHPRVLGAGLGEQDLIADVGAGTDEALLYARSRLVFAARASGVAPPFQSVWTDLEDDAGLRASCAHGKQLGFFGRSALHPRQVPAINEAFTPSEEEVAEAERLDALLRESTDQGAAGVRLPDGRFVDSAVVLAARRTLAFGRREQR